MVKSALRTSGFPLAWIPMLVMFVLVSACETEPTPHWSSSEYDPSTAAAPVASGSDAGSDDEQDAGTSGDPGPSQKCQGQQLAFYLDGDSLDDDSGGTVGGEDYDLLYPGTFALDESNAMYAAEASSDGVVIYIKSNDDEQNWSAKFRTRVPSEQLQPGIYEVQDTREPEGPYMEMKGRSADYPAQIDGCGYVCGTFEVHEVRINGSTVERFRASFVQHCRCATAELRGCVAFTR